MARPREHLREILRYYLGSDNTYFEPPNDAQMNYPCIVYHFEGEQTMRADNGRYVVSDRYTIKVISRNSDNKIYLRLLNAKEFFHISYDRRYMEDNLVHDVLILYW